MTYTLKDKAELHIKALNYTMGELDKLKEVVDQSSKDLLIAQFTMKRLTSLIEAQITDLCKNSIMDSEYWPQVEPIANKYYKTFLRDGRIRGAAYNYEKGLLHAALSARHEHHIFDREDALFDIDNGVEWKWAKDDVGRVIYFLKSEIGRKQRRDKLGMA